MTVRRARVLAAASALLVLSACDSHAQHWGDIAARFDAATKAKFSLGPLGSTKDKSLDPLQWRTSDT